MTDAKRQSPVQQAKKRFEETKRREAELRAKLVPRTDQGQVKEEDAKRIAAALMELMKR